MHLMMLQHFMDFETEIILKKNRMLLHWLLPAKFQAHTTFDIVVHLFIDPRISLMLYCEGVDDDVDQQDDAGSMFTSLNCSPGAQLSSLMISSLNLKTNQHSLLIPGIVKLRIYILKPF